MLDRLEHAALVVDEDRAVGRIARTIVQQQHRCAHAVKPRNLLVAGFGSKQDNAAAGVAAQLVRQALL